MRKLRKNALILVSLATLTGTGALVKVHAERRRSGRIEEVRALLEEPVRAQALLLEYFPEDQTAEITGLREEIISRQRDLEIARKNVWSDLFRAAQTECGKGDPLLALQKIVDLPEPPKLTLLQEAWPTKASLYSAIVDHMLADLAALGTPVEGASEQMRVEDDEERAVQAATGSRRDEGEQDVTHFRSASRSSRGSLRRAARDETRKRAESDSTQQNMLPGRAQPADAGDYSASTATRAPRGHRRTHLSPLFRSRRGARQGKAADRARARSGGPAREAWTVSPRPRSSS